MLLLIAAFLCGFGLLTYLTHIAFLALACKAQDLKKKYDAKWALVTGSSSGIGKSLAKRLADQGLNVVLVALQDAVFDETMKELQAAHPKLEFRKVSVDLSKGAYLDDIKAATRDIDVQLVFCNAGYILTGFFEDRPLDAHLANMEVNASSAVAVTHHFLQAMLSKKLRGCFVYTSSPAAMLPGPFSVLYASTKSFISTFGASLASEVGPYGIDVCVVHPSPVASRFYERTHKLDMLDFFKQLAVHPDRLPDTVFACIGRTVWADLGPTAIGFRLATKLVDYNFLAFMMSKFAHWLPDFQRQAKAKAGKSQ